MSTNASPASPPYKWDFVSVRCVSEVLEYWLAPCSVIDCTGYAEASWRIMPDAIVKLRPLCPQHDNHR